MGSCVRAKARWLFAAAALAFSARAGAGPTVWIERARLVAADSAANDGLGASVAVDGETIVAGAPLATAQAGAAYVFAGSGAAYTEQAKLVPSDPAFSQDFGQSVAVDAELAVVGAPGDTGDSGAAYVFARTGTLWTQEQKLVSSAPEPSAWFGFSVALHGSQAAVGAYGEDVPGAADGGAVHVLERTGTAWSEVQRLVASDSLAGAGFGLALSLDGDSLLVGAPWASAAATSTGGAAYVLTRAGSSWTEQQKLVASAPETNSGFGFTVGLSGNTAVVGAWLTDQGAQQDVGAAWVFVRSGTTWSEQQKLVASDGFTQDGFGYAVAVSGDTTLLGAWQHGAFEGAGYVFERSGGSWSEQGKLQGSGLAPFGEAFGYSIAMHAQRAAFGAWTSGANSAGAVYVFEPHLADGQPCSLATECASAACEDGVCCDRVCGAACQACTAAAKGGGSDGVCEPVAEGSDPDGDCDAEPASSCGRTGACDAAGGCALHGAGVECVPAACHPTVEGLLVTARVCDGNGACLGADLVACDSGHRCKNGACAATCSDDGDCSATHWCDAGACAVDLQDGEPCERPGQCSSGHCVDALCCDEACDAACERCDTDGKCELKPVGSPGAPACVPFVCDGSSHECPTVCAAAGCAEGYGCVQGECVSASSCKDASTVVDPSGEQRSCEGFACKGGACRQACTSTDDCAPGWVCDLASAICARPVGETEEEAGCGCRAVIGPAGSPLAVALAFALAALARSRRRAGRAAP